MRTTSIEAYNQIREMGLLSKLRYRTYSILFHHGPLTANQVSLKSNELYGSSLKSNLWQRLSELRDVGVVFEVSAGVICPVSGHKVILWDVTDKLPVKLERPKKHKCDHCGGKGYFVEQQTILL